MIVLPCDKWHTLYPGVRYARLGSVAPCLQHCVAGIVDNLSRVCSTLKITLYAVPVAAISHHVAEQQLQVPTT